MVNEARQFMQGTAKYISDVQNYADQRMLPVELEEMLTYRAAELNSRSYRIERVVAAEPIIVQLRQEAARLTRLGRSMRTAQTLVSRKPTDGMLDDLVRQDVVEIRRDSSIQNLGKRQDGRNDYLQEYEVWTKEAPRLLWYVHFHYGKPTPGLMEFEKAHLKLPEYRFKTHADDPSLPYADIGKRSAALEHFKTFDKPAT